MTLARALLFLALPLSIAPADAGARTLDRRAAIRIALEQNPQIAAARADEEVVRAQGRQADAARWPLVSLTAAVGPALQATLVPGTADQSVEKQYQDFHCHDLSTGAVRRPDGDPAALHLRQDRQAAGGGGARRCARARRRRA